MFVSILGMGVGIVASCNIAAAGLVEGSFDCSFPGDPYMYRHEWGFDYGLADLTITETLDELGPDVVELSGETNADLTSFTVVAKVTNNTAVTWGEYRVTLYDPAAEASFVEDSASAAGANFQTVTYPDSATIWFSGDDPVLDGHLVMLQFDILVPTAGTFELTLTQTPAPEPTTIALLGLGALAILRRRQG